MKKRKRKEKKEEIKKKLIGKQRGESNIYKKKDRNRPLNQTIPIQKVKKRDEKRKQRNQKEREKERKKEKFSY